MSKPPMAYPADYVVNATVLAEAMQYGPIVAVSVDADLFVTWNVSQTFNVWSTVSGENVDCFTRTVSGVREAEMAATVWLSEEYREDLFL